jgi:AcrR family transcriptional regulator
MERVKQECILGAAVRAFQRFGFRKASIEEIARDAGVAKGTVYLAYESKEDLFYQAVHRELREWIAEMSKLVDPRRPADELLQEVSRASMAMMDGRPLVRDLFIGLVHGQLPGWTERLEELRGLGRSMIVEILRLGVRQGRFRADLDIEETAVVLQDLQLAGYLTVVRAGIRDPGGLERRSQAAFSLVLDGLRTGRSR